MSDEREFSRFVRAHTGDLLRTAYLLTGDGIAAEELVQDTLVRLYPKWQLVAGAELPLAYVRRSLANGFVNHDPARVAARDDSRVPARTAGLRVTAPASSTTGTSCGRCCASCPTGSAPRSSCGTSTTCPTRRSARPWAAGSARCAASSAAGWRRCANMRRPEGARHGRHERPRDAGCGRRCRAREQRAARRPARRADPRRARDAPAPLLRPRRGWGTWACRCWPPARSLPMVAAVVGIGHLHTTASPKPPACRTACRPGADRRSPTRAPPARRRAQHQPDPGRRAAAPDPGGVTGFRATDLTFVSETQGWALGSAACAAGRCTALFRTTNGKTWTSMPGAAFNVPGVRTALPRASSTSASPTTRSVTPTARPRCS